MRKGDVLGKTIVAVEEATRLGLAEDVLFDQEGQLQALIIKRKSLAGHSAVLFNDVISIGPDVITVTTKSAMRDPKQFPGTRGLPSLRGALDCRVITLGGKLLGQVDDFNIDGLSRRILSLELRRANVVGMLMDELAGGKLTIPYIGRLRYGKEAVVVPGTVIGDRPLAGLEAHLEADWIGQPMAPALEAAIVEPLPAAEPIQPALLDGHNQAQEPVLAGSHDQPTQVIRVAEVQ